MSRTSTQVREVDGATPTPPPAPPWWRRRAVVVLAVVVLGASSVGLYVSTRNGHPASEAGPRSQATRPPKPDIAEEPEPEAPPTMVPPLTALPTTTAAPTTTAPPQVTVERPAPIRDTGYRLDFADDFDGAAPNPAVWATAPFGNSLPATVAGGVMTLRSTAANAYQWAYIASTGPRRDGEPSYTNPKAWQQGYFEARVRYTDDPWSQPAFWLFSMNKTETWPAEDCSKLIAEWDIMENGVENGPGEKPARDWYFTSLHRNTGDNTDDGYCGTPDEERRFSKDFTGTNLSDWHVWAAYWSPDTFCTYMDGVQIQCSQPWDTTAQPMHLTFSTRYLSRCDGCPPRPSELELQVDWVRVWQAP